MKYFIQYLQKDPVAVNVDPLLGISGLIDAFFDSHQPDGHEDFLLQQATRLKNKSSGQASVDFFHCHFNGVLVANLGDIPDCSILRLIRTDVSISAATIMSILKKDYGCTVPPLMQLMSLVAHRM